MRREAARQAEQPEQGRRPRRRSTAGCRPDSGGPRRPRPAAGRAAKAARRGAKVPGATSVSLLSRRRTSPRAAARPRLAARVNPGGGNVADDPDPRVAGGERLGRAVGAAVVDDHDLQVRRPLRLQGLDAAQGQLARFVRGDDDGQPAHGGS